MFRDDTTPALGDPSPAVACTLFTLRGTLADTGASVLELDRLDTDDLRLVYTEGEAEGIEAKIVGAYLGVRRGDDDWRAAVRSLADTQQAVGEALAWTPGALYATCTEPPSTPDRQAYSWHVEAEWAEAHRAGDLSDEALLDRVNETLEGPFPYEPADE